MMPYELEYGIGYRLVEVEAVPPYVRNDEPVYFDVTGSGPNQIITVELCRRGIRKRGLFSLIGSCAPE
jgi:hypothetical protein